MIAEVLLQDAALATWGTWAAERGIAAHEQGQLEAYRRWLALRSLAHGLRNAPMGQRARLWWLFFRCPAQFAIESKVIGTSKTPLRELKDHIALRSCQTDVGRVQTLEFLGPIGIGRTPSEIVERLDPAATLTLRIDSGGGCGADALELYQFLRPFKSTAEITFAGSAAVLVAMSAARRLIRPNGRLMIHGCQSSVIGNAATLRQVAKECEELDQRQVEILSLATGQSRETVTAWLSDGTDHYFTPEQCVENGLVHEIAEFK